MTLDTLSLEAGTAKVSGRFTSTVCAKESQFDDIDPANCLPVEGTFETALSREN